MSVNPRNRNFLPLGAHMAKPAELPAIEVPRTNMPRLDEFLRYVKEVLDVRHGRGNNPMESWVTERRMDQLGLRGGLVLREMPGDMLGIPVWTSRSTFVLVNLLALLKALGATAGTGEDTEVSAAEFAALRARVDHLSGTGSVSATQLNTALNDLRRDLERKMEASIRTANDSQSAAINQRIDGVYRTAQEAFALAARPPGRVIKVDTASDVWTIDHGQNRYVTVTVMDDNQEHIFPDVVQDDQNTVTITHSAPMTGWVVIR